MRIFGVACVLLTITALAAPLRAEQLDDYVTAGYTVMRSTYVVGSFLGCRRQETISFMDGSRFSCTATVSQASYQPRVYILRHDTDKPSVVLIGAHAYGGSLSQIGTHQLLVPLPISADPLPAPIGKSRIYDASPLEPIGPVQSINALQFRAAKPLNDAQNDPLPRPVMPPRP